MLTLVPNMTPSTETAPDQGAGNNPQEEDKPRSCLDRRPVTAEDDDRRNGGVGWINYWAKEKYESGGRRTRPTGAQACLSGSPDGDRGTEAGGNITGWADAQSIAKDGGFTVNSQETPLARCHFIARELGGRGKAANLAPCFQVGTNTGPGSMRSFEISVGAALNNQEIVEYTVIALYNSPSSTIPKAFFMVAFGQKVDGRPGVRDFAWVRNEKFNLDTGSMVQLGN
ncbi:DNA/RNA non-specific endonuclease [Kitasatospora sp. NPDC092286]|uniref:DNA/RNA non-specific endonuclease n=1 Tax=Kitasatospora sp. NPDC092286 TaxID=3364087 RepID=UPI003813A1F9